MLNVVVKSYSAEKLIELGTRRRVGGGGGSGKGGLGTNMGIKEILEVVERYTERHYSRIDDLVAETYLVEYT